MTGYMGDPSKFIVDDESAIVNPEQAAVDDTIEIPRRKLHEFFTRRVLDWWTRKDRSKYKRHVGAQQQLRAQMGISRADAKAADRALQATPRVFTVLPQEEV